MQHRPGSPPRPSFLSHLLVPESRSARSVPSRRPMTRAPRNAGRTSAFHARWLVRLRVCVGGIPRAAASVDDDVEELMMWCGQRRLENHNGGGGRSRSCHCGRRAAVIRRDQLGCGPGHRRVVLMLCVGGGCNGQRRRRSSKVAAAAATAV
jgi:hypothetical protein